MPESDPLLARHPDAVQLADEGYVVKHNRHSSFFTLRPGRTCWVFAQGGLNAFLELTLDKRSPLWDFAAAISRGATPVTDAEDLRLGQIRRRMNEVGYAVRDISGGGKTTGETNDDGSHRIHRTADHAADRLAGREAPYRLLTIEFTVPARVTGPSPLDLVRGGGAVAALVYEDLYGAPETDRRPAFRPASVAEAMNRR